MSGAATLLVEGGGLRGAFAAGVLSELDKAGHGKVANVVAISSGAPTAVYLASGQADDFVTIWRDYTHSRQLLSFANWLRRKPAMDIDRLVDVFRDTVRLNPSALDQSPTRVWIGVTNAKTGESEMLRASGENVFELLRAAMALPVANARVITVEGKQFVDGGVADPIPLDFSLALSKVDDHSEPKGETWVILTRSRGYRRSTGTLGLRFVGATYPRFPKLREALLAMPMRANSVLDRLDDPEFVARHRIRIIRPEAPLPVGRLTRDPAAIAHAIEIGRVTARTFLLGLAQQ